MIALADDEEPDHQYEKIFYEWDKLFLQRQRELDEQQQEPIHEPR